MSEFHEALRLRPDCPAYHNNRALIWLRLGEWRKGWDEFEWRWQCRGFSQPNFTQPRWDGGDLAGKTILLWAEQGLGDTLQFVRYAAVLKERGATVVVECPAVLHPLLAECSGINRLIARAADRPAFDVHAPLMSLPGLVGTAVDTVPGPNPYLSAKPDLVTHWQQELKPIAGFRIGVCWQGSTKFTGDWLRSFPLSQLAPLAAVPGVRLVSLQKGHGVEQLAASAGRLEIVDLGSKLDQTGGAFLDTAAVIKNLDLVVTCDTAIGHLAGALGAPVWLALSRSADWRWLLDRTDTPWYPTMRLFRQKELGKWEDVFAEMARELNGALHSSRRARPVMTEIAPGELVDKITILELKSEYIRNADKLRNVAHELRLLRATHAEALPPSAQLSQLTTELKAVNAALWDIEDAIRDCERRGDFGPRFIELARSVYRQNDRRAALKRSINDLLGSRVVEEKAYAAY